MPARQKGFLQGDTYYPVGFYCTEIPDMMFLEESDVTKWAHHVKERLNAHTVYL